MLAGEQIFKELVVPQTEQHFRQPRYLEQEYELEGRRGEGREERKGIHKEYRGNILRYSDPGSRELSPAFLQLSLEDSAVEESTG